MISRPTCLRLTLLPPVTTGPEYRLHAACFALRSMACIALYHVERQRGWQPNYSLNYAILMACMAAADLSSWSVGAEHRSRSVRDLNGAHPALQFFFSFAQFQAGAGLLYGLRRCTLPYLVLVVVQTTPFVATLRRKNLFTSNGAGAGLYGGMLVLSAAIVQGDYLRAGGRTALVVRTVAQMAALQRTTPLPDSFRAVQNKYVVWTCMFWLLRHWRARQDEMPVGCLKAAWATTFLMCLALGYCKTRMRLSENSHKKIKSV